MEPDKDNQTAEIVGKYLRNRHSAQTEEAIQQWLIEDENSAVKEEASLEYWNTLQSTHDSRTSKSLKKVNARSGLSARISLRRQLMRVAAILIPALFIFVGVYYLSQKEEIIQVAALPGETKHVVLPDKSEVWLNAGSSIQYPSAFGKGDRMVTMEGEAWFAVQKDPTKPFVVSTHHLSIQVLGTEFNVKAYPEEYRTIATLAAGKIEVRTNSNQTRTLEPNEQLVFDNRTASIHVEKVAANDASSWMTGQLIFTDASFEEIIQTLERHFNLAIEVERSIGKPDEHYTIKFLKNDQIEQVLNVLKDIAGDFSYKRTGNKIVITPH